MAARRVTQPTVEPVSVDEVKGHLRLDGADLDDYLGILIRAAREAAESYQNRCFINQTWDLTLDSFPCRPWLKIPNPPLVSITHLKYTDANGHTTTWDPSNYQVDTASEPGRLALVHGKSWPDVTLQPIGGVSIRFVAGYGEAGKDVPFNVRTAILLLVANWFENPEAVNVGNIVTEMPFGVSALLGPDRMVPA